MAGFFRKLGREKLYKQWVDKEGLSPDDLPEDLKKNKNDIVKVEDDDSLDEISPRRGYRPRTGSQVDDLSTVISTRFILVMVLVIMVLLIIVSVLATVLIMR